MTQKEMDDVIQEYCGRQNYECGKCVIESSCDECGGDFIDPMNYKQCKEAYDLLMFGEKTSKNPYWERICKLQDKQREKGIKTYGQGLEDNHEPVIKRIQHIEEELVDALMYLEWLKDALGGNIDG